MQKIKSINGQKEKVGEQPQSLISSSTLIPLETDSHFAPSYGPSWGWVLAV